MQRFPAAGAKCAHLHCGPFCGSVLEEMSERGHNLFPQRQFDRIGMKSGSLRDSGPWQTKTVTITRIGNRFQRTFHKRKYRRRNRLPPGINSLHTLGERPE